MKCVWKCERRISGHVNGTCMNDSCMRHSRVWLTWCIWVISQIAKEPYKRGYYILQKRPIIFRRLLIVATPYVNGTCMNDWCTKHSGVWLIWCVWVMSHIWTSQVTHMNKEDTYTQEGHTCVARLTRARMKETWRVHTERAHMGWLRLVGSINYRSLLQNIVSFIGLFCRRDL